MTFVARTKPTGIGDVRYRRRFVEFLRALGMEPSDATAAHKILWMETFIDRGARHGTLRALARAIRTLGVGTTIEIAEQHQLVLAYLHELKNSTRLTAPVEPSPAMPQAVFRRFIAMFERNWLFALRLKAIFLLVWWTGLSMVSITHLRRRSIEFVEDGINLTWTPGYSRTERRKFVPLHSNPELCLVRSLRKWRSKSRMPAQPDVFFFPAIGKTGTITDWQKPFAGANTCVFMALEHRLRTIGVADHGYTLTSLRRTHAIRCRKSLGSAMAVYQTGFASEHSLSSMLRAEPDWERVPRSVLEGDDLRAGRAGKKGREKEPGREIVGQNDPPRLENYERSFQAFHRAKAATAKVRYLPHRR